jgi:hypothetical protein
VIGGAYAKRQNLWVVVAGLVPATVRFRRGARIIEVAEMRATTPAERQVLQP